MRCGVLIHHLPICPVILARREYNPAKDAVLSQPEVRQLSKNAFPRLEAGIFLIVAVAHALRLIFKWVVLIGGWQVPMWVSAVGIVVAAYLAYQGFRTSQSKQIR